MKKNTILTALLFFAITSTSFAQGFDPYAKHYYGLKLGLTGGTNVMFVNKKSPLYKKDSPILGYSFGASYETRFSERTSLLLNVNYQKTHYNSELINYYDIGFYSSNTSSGFPKLANELQLESVNIPLMLRFYLGYLKLLFIDLGGYYNHVINAKEFNRNNASTLSKFTNPSNHIFTPNDSGLVLGFGYNIEFDENNNIAIELRDNYGLSNIIKSGNLDTPTYQNVVSLQLNYTANFNKTTVKK